MYERVSESSLRQGDIWWLPAAWWPDETVYVLRPVEETSERIYRPRRHLSVDSAWQYESEVVVQQAKRRNCLILSPDKDIEMTGLERIVALQLMPMSSLPEGVYDAVRRQAVAHCFPLDANDSFGMDERYLDFTRPVSIPRRYLAEPTWYARCRVTSGVLTQILEHYARWLSNF